MKAEVRDDGARMGGSSWRPRACPGLLLAVLCPLLVLWLAAALSAHAEDVGSGFVGLEVQAANAPARMALGYGGSGGVLIRDVAAGGPGQAAGLRRGDLLLAFDGVALNGLQQLVGYMGGTRTGQAISLDLWREGRRDSRTLTLGDWPPGWHETVPATAVVPRLGVTLQALVPEVRQAHGVRWGTTGVVVAAAAPDGAAARAGLRPGDVIVAIGREGVARPAEAGRILEAAGGVWWVLVDRGDAVLRLGPGVSGAAAPVAGMQVLAAALDDGPYVMDVALGGPAVRPGGTLPTMPEPLTLPSPAHRVIDVAGLTVASLSAEARAAHGLRWSSRGVVVEAVQRGSAAQGAGLAAGHVIRSVNQHPVTGADDLAARIATATARYVLLVVETRRGFRLVPLRRDGVVAGGGPPGVEPVFQFGRPPG